MNKYIEATRMNTHQTHFEDLVTFGTEGFDELNSKIEAFLADNQDSAGRLNTTTKIDGAPAVVCWSKFDGYPDNSIQLKSFVGGAAKALSTPEQIDERYPDPGMGNKLKFALELAHYIPEGEAWQGDVLFTAEDLEERNIHGKDYLTFQPNTIIYSIPHESPSYEKIVNADFGIAFHTIYKDAGEGKKTQSFKVDPNRIGAPENYYIMSVDLAKGTGDNSAQLNQIETKYSQELSQYYADLTTDPAYNAICENEGFMAFWNTFENKNIADKRSVTLNVASFIEDLWEYIDNKTATAFNKKYDSLKTEKGKINAKAKYESEIAELSDLVQTNKDTLIKMAKALNCAAEIKMIMWEMFRTRKADYDTFFQSKSQGYIPAEMEGVAMSDSEGNIVKVVDRTTFSANNRSDDIISGFDHKNNLTRKTEQIFLDILKEASAPKEALYLKIKKALKSDTDSKLTSNSIQLPGDHHNAQDIINNINVNEFEKQGLSFLKAPGSSVKQGVVMDLKQYKPTGEVEPIEPEVAKEALNESKYFYESKRLLNEDYFFIKDTNSNTSLVVKSLSGGGLEDSAERTSLIEGITADLMENVCEGKELSPDTMKWDDKLLADWSKEDTINQVKYFFTEAKKSNIISDDISKYSCKRRDDIAEIDSAFKTAMKFLGFSGKNDNYNQADIVLYTEQGLSKLSSGVDTIKSSTLESFNKGLKITELFNNLLANKEIILISLKKPADKAKMSVINSKQSNRKFKDFKFKCGENSKDCWIVFTDENNIVYKQQIRLQTGSSNISLELSGGGTSMAKMGKSTALFGITKIVNDLHKAVEEVNKLNKISKSVYDLLTDEDNYFNLNEDLFKFVRTEVKNQVPEAKKDSQCIYGLTALLLIFTTNHFKLDALYYYAVRENFGASNIWPIYIKLY